MKVEDLMIGDWVYITDYPMRKEVKQITPGHFVRSLVEFEPIPLTPKILEKNGFENVDNLYPFPTFRIDDKENYFCITIGFPKGNKTRIKYPFIEIDVKNIFIEYIKINFVHELQHALKLCGIDKNIEL